MNKVDWENILPEVSEEFHNRAEVTLKIISERERKKHMSKKYRVLLVAVAIMIIGSITASATGLFKWNHQVAEQFGASEEQQHNLISKGVTEQKEASVTDSGLTISLVQTLQDKDYIYIALEVTAPDAIMLSGTNLFETSNVCFAGNYEAISGGFMTQTEADEPTNNRIYEYWIHKASGTDLDGTDITLSFENLQADAGKLEMYTILEGKWELSWSLNYNDSTKYYDLNRTYSLSGYDVLVDRVEVSPLSMTIYYDADDIKNMEKLEGVNLNHLDFLEPIEFRGFKYKDGRRIQLYGGCGGARINKNAAEYIVTTSFEKVINVEDIECILLGQSSTEMKLIEQ